MTPLAGTWSVGTAVVVGNRRGSISKVGESLLKVTFSDASKAWVDPADCAAAFAVGAIVSVAGRRGTVAKVGEHMLRVQFDDGSKNWVGFDECAATLTKKRAASASDGDDERALKRQKKRQNAEPAEATSSIPPHRFVLAPMVGGSELAFRLLCRRYGADLCYSPMIYSRKFVDDAAYRDIALYMTDDERTGKMPLVAHFCGNDASTLLEAAKLAEKRGVAAIDLNLGCPQRIAHSGHFGSYLLGDNDRDLVVGIVRTLADNLTIPVFCKIRLLDTPADTLKLCRDLIKAGCKLIALHARYRGTATRRRDGPAHLDKFQQLKAALSADSACAGVPIVCNGNVRCGEDVVANLASTKADGIMSAEGLLDIPTLFMTARNSESGVHELRDVTTTSDMTSNQERKLLKKLREIERLEAKATQELSADEKSKLGCKTQLQAELQTLRKSSGAVEASDENKGNSDRVPDPLSVTLEYLALAGKFPVDAPLATVVFHVRRIAREYLSKYQMVEEVARLVESAPGKFKDDAERRSAALKRLRELIEQCIKYRDGKEQFTYDANKAREAQQRQKAKKQELVARRKFEERMIRKAKREGLDDYHYLKTGAAPCKSDVAAVRAVETEAGQKAKWKARFGSFCFDYCVQGRCRFAGNTGSASSSGTKNASSGALCPFKHYDVLDSAAAADGIEAAAALAQAPADVPSWLAENE
eukprot:TRINITY_DN3968_c0_g1_i1.p1 TRINITY_DN3968_c0_g1~~TRINITY_DN3968_c0_g1_i1.p1  ORF type:complete len:711 (-),score=131.56 TRINITY_DN3968_c0_g1_i1:52-2157(-)